MVVLMRSSKERVLTLHHADLLDVSVIHGDGDDAAKKGGDNIGFSGHKKVKGDKVMAFCEWNCNVIAPFISAPGNHNRSPLLREALPVVTPRSPTPSESILEARS